MNPLVFLFIAGLLAGCASTAAIEEDLAKYVGSKVERAIEDLGKPAGVYNMQNGTWEYVWKKASSFSKGGGTTLMGVPVSSNSRSECNRVLVVNRQKDVLDFRVEGNC